MNRSILEDLGFTVRDDEGSPKVELDLSSAQLINPFTRQVIGRAVFSVVGDRLMVVDPPELVGAPPVMVARIERLSDVEEHLVDAFNESMFHLSRRSSELSALGLSPHVDPRSLELSAVVHAGPLELVIVSDRMGNFRVGRAVKNGDEISVSSQAFELSEFRDRRALEGYLAALLGENLSEPAPQKAESSPPDGACDFVRYGDVVDRFGHLAVVPARTQLEVLVDIRVGKEAYRFAAARVAGRTFRGLLAGSTGKLWAERFELDEFPGVRALVAGVLGVPQEQVLVGGEEG